LTSSASEPRPPRVQAIQASYFNDTDELWGNYPIVEQLKGIGTRVLRYPGGEETSRLHWEHPGVNGYVDVWNPNERNRNGDWMPTSVPPAAWDTNEAFMSLEDYAAVVAELNLEPLLGVNRSSSEKHNRRADGIASAVRMVQRAKELGMPVRYIFFDNEP
jgi:alpha-L-arabinofuranosidase